MQVSTVLGFAIRSQREEAAWTEGIAIWVAVGVVSLVGAPFRHLLDNGPHCQFTVHCTAQVCSCPWLNVCSSTPCQQSHLEHTSYFRLELCNKVASLLPYLLLTKIAATAVRS